MAAEILDCPPCGAELTLAGWSQHTGAWCIVNLDELLSGPEVRGESVLIERNPGRSGRNRLPDETEYAIPYVFAGVVDRLGAPYPDADTGRAANLLAFRQQIVTGQLITGSLEWANGDTFQGECIAERLTVETRPGGLALASLRLIIPEPWEEAP